MEAPLTEEHVRRIILAAFQHEHPGAWRMNLALREAEAIRVELIEEYVAEIERHYQPELAGEGS